MFARATRCLMLRKPYASTGTLPLQFKPARRRTLRGVAISLRSEWTCSYFRTGPWFPTPGSPAPRTNRPLRSRYWVIPTATGWIDACYGSSGSCYWEDHTTSASAQAQFTGTLGYTNPKYAVVGVTYAPPGSSSSVTYASATSVGNTTQLSQSFQSDVGYSVSVSGSVGQTVPAGGVTPTGGVKLTFTQGNDYTQGSNSSNTDTISKSSAITYLTPGTPTLSPVNDDYDYIWIWINPELLTSYSPQNGSTPAAAEFNGSCSIRTTRCRGNLPQAGRISVGRTFRRSRSGCLNGDFQCPSTLTWANGVEGPGSYINSGNFARSWASSSAGYQWPAGEMPNLTFTTSAISQFRPACGHTEPMPSTKRLYAPEQPTAGTTSDGRFTRDPFPPNTIQYPVGGGVTEQYNAVQMNTESLRRAPRRASRKPSACRSSLASTGSTYSPAPPPCNSP